MIRYLDVNDENRVIGIADFPFEKIIFVEVEQEHEVNRNPFIFTYVDNELLKDAAYQEALIEESNDPKDTQLDLLIQQNAFLTEQVAILTLMNQQLAEQQANVLMYLAEKENDEGDAVDELV